MLGEFPVHHLAAVMALHIMVALVCAVNSDPLLIGEKNAIHGVADLGLMA